MFRPKAARYIAPVFQRRFLLTPFRRSIHYGDTTEVATIQRVKFRNHAFTWRRMVTPVVYAGSAYFLLAFILTTLLRDEIEEISGDRVKKSKANRDVAASQDGSEEEAYDEDEDEEWDEDDIWFIPLGLWARPRPREFYRGSDPEWREYARFSKDSKRHQRAREQLVSVVRQNIANDPRFKRVLGTVDVTQGKYWLDILFPDGPPLDYERSGIEIAPDGISWTSRTVTARNHQRFTKIVWPHAAFYAVYQSGKHMLQTHYNQMRDFLGLDSQLDDNPPTVQDALKKLASPPADTSEATKRTSSSSTKPPTSRGSQSTSPKEKNLGKIDFYPSAFDSTALHRFMETFTHGWKGFTMEPPRGTIVLKGLVSVHGDQGRMALLVTGFYEPKSEKFVGLGSQITSMQPRHQRPKGGS